MESVYTNRRGLVIRGKGVYLCGLWADFSVYIALGITAVDV
jgi:hypothetical protein